ncbi:hypothetical protein HMPREF1544_12080 [Mucor circinelloides 1006PhL]|uniref:Helitron helicase-like domain-containing protein n=1 Tax=Mucor circinelloides f. circinelloides (strain 1006PhL) TaxID=1220926 RepID=S2JN51_MUCC1|nr:hypothetical protein HMPREF1544_12080 [Mucor circinelloides 1006PhL]
MQKGPTEVCVCCGGLFFSTKVSKVKMSKIIEWGCTEETANTVFSVEPSIWTVRGTTGQFKSKGGIVNIPANVDTTVQAIPRSLLDDANIIPVELARRWRYARGYIKGAISSERVGNAALYLQPTPPLFCEYNVRIDIVGWLENAENFQDTAHAEDRQQEGERDQPQATATVNYEDAAQNGNSSADELAGSQDEAEQNKAVQEAGGGDEVVDPRKGKPMAPGENQIPLSLFSDQDSDYLSFIKVYMGRKLDPLPPVSYTSGRKSIARRYDRRAVMRPDCLLYRDRKMMLLKMAGNAKTVLRKTTNASTGRPHTVNNVLQGNLTTTLLSEDQAYKVLQGVRSSAEHWKTKKKKNLLMAMIRQFGIPTLFITLQAAEELTSRERAWLMQSDPVTCASYFDYRTEFQHRGSPHIHMLIWQEDAPRILPGSTENDARVCQFKDGIITCEKEWDGSSHTYDNSSTDAT